MSRKTLIVLVALLTSSTPVGAHRLDEYLQATLVGIDVNRVSLEIDLTPGVSIAKQVTGWIDTNGDGHLSHAEGLAYANQVLGSLALTVDRNPAPLVIRDVRLPEIGEIAEGLGTIRLSAAADLAASTGGRHEITVVNTHRRELSVYLANTLVPSDRRIQILTQQRDSDQHSLTIGYHVETRAALRRISWVAGALTLLGMVAIIRGPGRFRPSQTHPV